LGTAEFAYNNKVDSSTKTSLFKTNYRQDPRIGFEGRKKGKYKRAKKFMEKTKDLKYQMVKRRTEKLMKQFVGLYKIKKIVLSNAVELELPRIVKIGPVVNISRIRRYVGQVEGQRKEQLAPVIIEEEKK